MLHLEVRLLQLLVDGVEPIVRDEPGLGGEHAGDSCCGGVAGAVRGTGCGRSHLDVVHAPGRGGASGSLSKE